MEKKQSKNDEIDRVLTEDITPTLDKVCTPRHATPRHAHRTMNARTNEHESTRKDARTLSRLIRLHEDVTSPQQSMPRVHSLDLSTCRSSGRRRPTTLRGRPTRPRSSGSSASAWLSSTPKPVRSLPRSVKARVGVRIKGRVSNSHACSTTHRPTDPLTLRPIT